MDAFDQLENIRDQASFVAFAEALLNDRKQHSDAPDSGWENETIEAFLESAIAWAKDSEMGRTQGIDRENPWQQVAAFLYAGKVYE